MFLSGFADEAANDIEGQIRATRELGWSHIEARAIGGVNITKIDDAAFDRVCDTLDSAGIRINCFGSEVANWAQSIHEPPDESYQEMRRAIPRMQRLGVRYIRVMSFQSPHEPCSPLSDTGREVIRRMKEITRIAEDGGVTCVHENCKSWGGLSQEHTLRLLEEVASPSLKLVFDTGNPVEMDSCIGEPPHEKQDALAFYQAVGQHIVHIHIKDASMKNGKLVYTYPGEGEGRVREICANLHKCGYDGGITIEPHLAVVHHDASVCAPEEVRFSQYVEYGRRLEKLLEEMGWSANEKKDAR